MPRAKPKRPAVTPEQITRARGYFLQGASVADVLETLAKDFPEATPAKIVDAVFQEFKKAGAQDHLVTLGWCLEAARELFRKMAEVGDFAGALAALREIAKLKEKAPASLTAETKDPLKSL